MKRCRKIITFTLILVMPISLWASVSVASHCKSSNDSLHFKHMQIDGDMHKHMHNPMQSKDLNNNSNCECGCNGDQDCSVSGCNASVLSTTIEFDLAYLTQNIYQQAQALTKPSDPNLLFRPPISLS